MTNKAVLKIIAKMKPEVAKKRIGEAMADTRRIISKEKAYSEEFQDKELIAKYEAHLELLKKYLETVAA